MQTMQDLLQEPLRFDRQVVEVSGWYFHSREHHAIYPSVENNDPREGIWLVAHETATSGEKALRTLPRAAVAAL
jgi:hypothetical protein